MKRTQFAMKALGLAEMFQSVVGLKAIEGAVSFRVELATPDGPSTGGGAQAVQHINLIPADGGRTVVAGSANQKEKTAVIRTYERLVEQHARRYKGTAFTLEQPAYEQLVTRMEKFLTNQGFKVTREDAEQKLVITKSTDEQMLDKIKSAAEVSNRGAGTPANGSFRNTATQEKPEPALAPTPSAGFTSFPTAQPPAENSNMLLWIGLAIGAVGAGSVVFLMMMR